VKAQRELLRSRPARVFFFAHAQSSVGTGAGYVALVILAYDRLHSPWAIALILLADFLPEMLLGAFCGTLADRFPRRLLAVVAEGTRAVAFAGLVLAPSFAAMVGFALLAGLGTALFQPTMMAGMPGVVGERRLPAALGLFGAIDELGWVAGPALAAGLLAISGVETILLFNAATFVVSAALLARLRLDAPAPPSEREAPPARGLLVQMLDGIRAVRDDRFVRTLIFASGAAVVFMAMANVGELVLAVEDLGAGHTGYTFLAAAMCAGTALGSLAGGRECPDASRRNGFLWGLGVAGSGYLIAAVAPGLAVALAGFVVMGVGNGLTIVHERALLQSRVPETFKGRVFGVRGMLHSWAFATAFVSAGGIISALGARPLFLIVGAGTLVTGVAAALALGGRPARARGARVAAPVQ
jgi:MFS family permease